MEKNKIVYGIHPVLELLNAERNIKKIIIKDGCGKKKINEIINLARIRNIKVEFKESETEGVAGVIGNAISNITGATRITGFKGLSGKFARHSLMDFDSKITSSARFTRIDTNESVDVFYNPSMVSGHPNTQSLMQKVMMGEANSEEKLEFGRLWQERVKAILVDNCDNENVIRVIKP